MTAVPGRSDGEHQRDLDEDLERLRTCHKARLLVTLLERSELAALGIDGLIERTKACGLESDWVPMPRGKGVASLDELISLVERVLLVLRDGDVVLIHCDDGLGRSGLVASACLTALGTPADEAIEIVRHIRPGAVATVEQEVCVQSFDAVWRRRLMRLSSPDDISDMLGQPRAEKVSTPAGISDTGTTPQSHAGAATVSYAGLTPKALAGGVAEAAPLRKGALFHLPPGAAIYVGRSAECGIHIADSQLSKVHTLLCYTSASHGKLVVADMRSRTGTWVDGERIEVGLAHTGDEITLAQAYRFRFESIG